MGEKLSPTIRISKSSATDPIDEILFNLIIPGCFVNSYFAQVKPVKIFLFRNLARFEL